MGGAGSTGGQGDPSRAAAAGEHRSGFVAIFGRPNAGKSTFLNRVLGQKIAIVTPKPQTTRRQLLGIRTSADSQIIFIDTPGYHRADGPLNQRMVKSALRALPDADVVLWMVDAGRGLDDLEVEIARRLPANKKTVVAINKIDLVRKPDLLPMLERLSALAAGASLVPISALNGDGVDAVLARLEEVLPLGPRYYGGETLTDQSERSLAAEIIREKAMLLTQKEIPYAVAVTVDSFAEKPEKGLVVIAATIHVERDSQKGILIGRGGGKLRAIGASARRDIERLVGARVYLELFVRVQSNWTKRPSTHEDFGA